MLGQHKYFECYLHQLDTLANLKVSQLMEYHCNRFVRTYPGLTGKCAMAMDEYMEIRNRDLSLMAALCTLEGMCHKVRMLVLRFDANVPLSLSLVMERA